MNARRIERVQGTVVFEDGTEKPFHVTLPDATQAEEWSMPLVGALKLAEILRDIPEPAADPVPRTWKLQGVARMIADHNGLSHDWEDFMEAVEALGRAGLLSLDAEAR